MPFHAKATKESRRFLFLLTGSRVEGNTEFLARRAAAALSPDIDQTWIRLSDMALPPFEDRRHAGDGTYPTPTGHGLALLEATLRATDIVFAAPLYWYSLPAAAKLYLDHWSGWMRVADLDFKPRMAGKTLWAVSVLSDEDRRAVEPLLGTLRLTANYMSMRWGGTLLGFGNRPGDIQADADALAQAARFFVPAKGEPGSADGDTRHA